MTLVSVLVTHRDLAMLVEDCREASRFNEGNELGWQVKGFTPRQQSSVCYGSLYEHLTYREGPKPEEILHQTSVNPKIFVNISRFLPKIQKILKFRRDFWSFLEQNSKLHRCKSDSGKKTKRRLLERNRFSRGAKRIC